MEAGNEEKEGSCWKQAHWQLQQAAAGRGGEGRKTLQTKEGRKRNANIRIQNTLVARSLCLRANSPQIHTSEMDEDSPVQQSWFPMRT